MSDGTQRCWKDADKPDELILLRPRVLRIRERFNESTYWEAGQVHDLLRYIDGLHLRIEELKRAAKAD